MAVDGSSIRDIHHRRNKTDARRCSGSEVTRHSYAGQNLYVAAINTCGLMIIAPLIIVYLFGQQFLVQGIERSGLTAE